MATTVVTTFIVLYGTNTPRNFYMALKTLIIGKSSHRLGLGLVQTMFTTMSLRTGVGACPFSSVFLAGAVGTRSSLDVQKKNTCARLK